MTAPNTSIPDIHLLQSSTRHLFRASLAWQLQTTPFLTSIYFSHQSFQSDVNYGNQCDMINSYLAQVSMGVATARFRSRDKVVMRHLMVDLHATTALVVQLSKHNLKVTQAFSRWTQLTEITRCTQQHNTTVNTYNVLGHTDRQNVYAYIQLHTFKTPEKLISLKPQ